MHLSHNFIHMKFENPDITTYKYNLPDDRIAKYPVEKRDLSKLLIWDKGKISHHTFKDIHNHLPGNSLLIFNNTKVIPARINFKRKTGANIEVFLLEPIRPTSDIEQIMHQKDPCTWHCLIGNKKKWKTDEILEKEIISGNNIFKLKVSFDNHEKNEVHFSWTAPVQFAEVIEQAGIMPIPPYLNRKTETSDKQRYQTVYSKKEGAVAAPTAGLHFTPKVFDNLSGIGIQIDFITLHVSAGTFKPVKTKDYRNHPMHAEQIVFSKQNIRSMLNHNNKLIAVGTTSMRSLESLYWYGVKMITGKGDEFHIEKLFPYEFTKTDLPSKKEVFEYLLNYMDSHNMEKLHGETEIFIFPGYKFQVCDGLITNFHMPGSTLLLLVAAFTNGNWEKIYNEALEKNYRFLSYGDSSLLLRVCP